MTVRELLNLHDLAAYADAFDARRVGMSDLVSLSEDDLRDELGMESFQDRKRFKAAVASLAAGGSTPAPLSGATRFEPPTPAPLSGATRFEPSARPTPSLSGATRIEPAAALPQQLGSYWVLGLLGTGGMGTVVRARHVEEGWAQQQGGDVAIKLIHPQIATDPEFRSRFMSEAALGRKVQHPGFVPTFDVISEGAWLGTVMSFVTGDSLGSKVVPGGLSVDAVIALLAPIGEALDYLHGLGIVHRDLKPANIVVQPNGRPVVLDLGIAKDMQSGGNHTRTMTTMGTSAWMAPEQADAKHVDGAADRYAFGMIAYVLLAGQMPWSESTSEARVFSNKLMGQLVPLEQVCAGVPQHVAAAVMKMVSLEAGDRYSTCVGFVQALRVDDGAARAVVAAAKLKAEVEAAAKLQAEREAAARVKAEAKAAAKLQEQVAAKLKAEADAETAARVKAEAEAAGAKAALAAVLAREAVAKVRAEPVVPQEPESLAQDTTPNAPSGRPRPLVVATGLAVIVGLGVWAWIPNDEKEFAKLCNAPALSGVTVPFAEENEQIISRWVEANVRGYAAKTYAAIIYVDPQLKVPLLVAGAEEDGVVIDTRRCPLLSELGRTWESPTLGTMKWIPPGTFTMGSPETEAGRFFDEPQHSVTLSNGFLLMEHEVTQGEWQAVMGSNPSNFTACGATCPVEQVSWDDAVAFAQKASERDGVEYTLPTEAQWEYAARGGRTTGWETLYSGSDEATSVGWIDDNSENTTHAVCGLSRNGYGLCDMTGNVWEWTLDGYGDYAGSATDPTGASAGSYRVNRGGSWDYSAQDARVAFRGRSDPTLRNLNLGFRLSRTGT